MDVNEAVNVKLFSKIPICMWWERGSSSDRQSFVSIHLGSIPSVMKIRRPCKVRSIHNRQELQALPHDTKMLFVTAVVDHK